MPESYSICFTIYLCDALHRPGRILRINRSPRYTIMWTLPRCGAIRNQILIGHIVMIFLRSIYYFKECHTASSHLRKSFRACRSSTRSIKQFSSHSALAMFWRRVMLFALFSSENTLVKIYDVIDGWLSSANLDIVFFSSSEIRIRITLFLIIIIFILSTRGECLVMTFPGPHLITLFRANINSNRH